MLRQLSFLKNGISEVLFPSVCFICGLKLSNSEHSICTNCASSKFEIANPEFLQSSSNTILPESVHLQHALWNFDKGGFLQDLLHELKYKRNTSVGLDFGMALGKNLKKLGKMKFDESEILIPVPLHPKKNRMRGYNQARFIAQGISKVCGIKVCDAESVLRVKNTKTQTGFTLEKRRENIQNAFLINHKDAIENKDCIIVDDVFTTGATAFELAETLLEAGAHKILIITVAQA